ncbi:MAG: bifunctional aspartate kinase/diaminopimelate decarboxylase [Steroidobacteraceae bacterium]
MSSPWVVLKFGGTSVSSRANWDNITRIVREREAEGPRVLVVHSALSGVTDALTALLAQALAGTHAASIERIAGRHRKLAATLGIAPPREFEQQLQDLGRLAEGIALVGEVSDPLRARVLAAGELLATALGAEFLRTQGIAASLVDARTLLKSASELGRRASVLSTNCDFAPDPAWTARLSALPGVILTQGFIAAGADGQTVLLGRGGSDTSAAYFAAKLRASRLEIWSDVPGMFSANPRAVTGARLLKALDYDEAQEIATSGAKVLHPRCIRPARQYGIPIHLHATPSPDLPGTVIAPQSEATGARLKAIALRKGITLISMETAGMWQQVGFLADAFAVFKQHGISVDLISSSETNVTVSLDPQAHALSAAAIAMLAEDLGRFCRVTVIGPCAALSLLGRNIRTILHRLGVAFEVFEEQHIHLVSQAANDLNFTFVIDEDQADRLVAQLHELLIEAVPNDPVMGPTWEQLNEPATVTTERRSWWRLTREALIERLGDRRCAYVYDLATVAAQAQALAGLKSVSRVLYAMKANPHPAILQALAAEGLSFECVSPGEVERLLFAAPRIAPDRILFTPNFAPRAEYEWALTRRLRVTVDNLHVLSRWGDLFRDLEIFVRIDPGRGHGHHPKVRTAGVHSKFGVPMFELGELAEAARAAGAKVVGLHAHLGSGHFDVASWAETAAVLAEAATQFPDVKVLNVGGGLGVPDRPARRPLDVAALDAALAPVRESHPAFELWLEPGRFLVAIAGVLLARVTQLKGKGTKQYLGVATGMNSLLRPALYGAYHEIVNLTRLGQPSEGVCTVVGPICESGDVLGHDRLLPRSVEGDILLIANAGAYGHAMGSNYNLRPPAEELIL